MAFDDKNRNLLQKMVDSCRRLLSAEFTKQLQELYGIQPGIGSVIDLSEMNHLTDDHYSIASLLRDRINHLASGLTGEKNPIGGAVDRVVREQAFTVLNRFAALRMSEEREIVRECIRNGMQSQGFKVYLQIAGSSIGDTYQRYRVFLGCLFDELAIDLGTLFDRYSPFALLFPREQALIELLNIINDPQLKDLWKEDETIGWIYQYFNTKEERETMRKASQAPRNSRELAVRNQFFTPRYVVEFLTDNTLGRIWYEMAKGNTGLKDNCRYLVRRPNEVFLAEGEDAPAGSSGDSEGVEKSQEELLKEPAYIPHRPVKDPRTITMLDPACGSMHFGLYAFEVYETIYEEAWDNYPELLADVREQVSSKDDFLQLVPELIIRHNIHGIDIDPRACQIAELSLWLRAQKAFQKLKIKAQDRPRITKSNIVCAEPMPGEKEMLEEFIAKLKPAVLGDLVREIWNKMQLAGEAGSLLKIEEELKSAIDKAKNEWERYKAGDFDVDPVLFKEMEKPVQGRMRFDVTGVKKKEFWDEAETLVLTSLRDFAESATNGHGYQRKLFSEDAVHGFAFIDLCRKKFDVVLMNPPFGESCTGVTSKYLKASYPASESNIAAVFIERGVSILQIGGRLGYIADKSLAVRSSYEAWRRNTLLNNTIDCFVDGGWGVLDDAFVETHFVVVSAAKTTLTHLVVFFDLQGSDTKERTLLSTLPFGTHVREQRIFLTTPNFTFIYQLPSNVLDLFQQPSLDPSVAHVRIGTSPGDAFRFYRYYWETPSDRRDWLPIWNGGEFSPFYRPAYYVIRWSNEGRELQNLTDSKGNSLSYPRNLDYYRRKGLNYGKRGHLLNPHVMNSDCGFTDEGQGIFPFCDEDLWMILAYLNSVLARALVNSYCGQHKHSGYVRLIPLPPFNEKDKAYIGALAKKAYTTILTIWRSVIEHSLFVSPWVTPPVSFAQHKTLLSESAIRSAEILDDVENEINQVVVSKSGLDNEIMTKLESFLDKTTRFRNSIADPIISDVAHDFSCRQNIDYFIGCILGRWNISFATGERQPSEPTDPFEPLPVCPPGMLQNDDGMQAEAKDVSANYPLRIAWDGVLVDDPSNQYDIINSIQEVLEIIWKDKADAIEQELCEILGVKRLRDYFSKPSGFFADHLKRYSKSRRQAPIYWPLSTKSGNYTLWIYYHRLTDQTLYKCINDFVNPKIDDVSRRVEKLQSEIARGGNSKQKEELADQIDFLQELKDFRDELLRVAQLPYKPNLNDGVLITASPLHNLFALPKWKKDLEECWKKLNDGEYDWAHLAYSIWPDRVKQACKKDRSIAIAHGLEELCEIKAPEKKVKKKKSVEEKPAVGKKGKKKSMGADTLAKMGLGFE